MLHITCIMTLKLKPITKFKGKNIFKDIIYNFCNISIDK